MASTINYPVYEPSVTVVCKPSCTEQGELKANPYGTQYGKIPDLVLKLYGKSKTLEIKND